MCLPRKSLCQRSPEKQTQAETARVLTVMNVSERVRYLNPFTHCTVSLYIRSVFSFFSYNPAPFSTALSTLAMNKQFGVWFCNDPGICLW